MRSNCCWSLGAGPRLPLGFGLHAQELIQAQVEDLGQEGQHGGGQAHMATLVIGKGLLGDPQLGADLVPPVPTMLRQNFFTRLSYGGHGRKGNVGPSLFRVGNRRYRPAGIPA